MASSYQAQPCTEYSSMPPLKPDDVPPPLNLYKTLLTVPHLARCPVAACSDETPRINEQMLGSLTRPGKGLALSWCSPSHKRSVLDKRAVNGQSDDTPRRFCWYAQNGAKRSLLSAFMFGKAVVGVSDAVYTTGPDRFKSCRLLHVCIVREEYLCQVKRVVRR